MILQSWCRPTLLLSLRTATAVGGQWGMWGGGMLANGSGNRGCLLTFPTLEAVLTHERSAHQPTSSNAWLLEKRTGQHRNFPGNGMREGPPIHPTVQGKDMGSCPEDLNFPNCLPITNTECKRRHRLENILLDADHNVKIADFGMGAALKPGPGTQCLWRVGAPKPKRFPSIIGGIAWNAKLQAQRPKPPSRSRRQTLTTRCGSLEYAAPEVLEGTAGLQLRWWGPLPKLSEWQW